MFMRIFTYHSDDVDLPYIDTGGDKPVLHFSHANGIPVLAYEPLLRELAKTYRVLGLGLRGQLGGASDGPRSWHQLASDLERFLDSLEVKSIYAVGHSIGGIVSMFCAARRPDLFSRLVMIEPVLLPPDLIRVIRQSRLAGSKEHSPLAVRALARKNGWADKTEALDYFRGRNMFEGWRDEFLRAYVENCLTPAPHGGLMLLCPPEVEAQGFDSYSTDVWAWPGRLSTSVTIIRGGQTDVLLPLCFEKFKRLCTYATAVEWPDCNHFIPMQQPERLFKLILDFDS